MDGTARSESSSWVKLNKLRDGYSWNITVAADGNSLDVLRDAKARAILISRELDAELGRDREPTVEEVPF